MYDINKIKEEALEIAYKEMCRLFFLYGSTEEAFKALSDYVLKMRKVK